MMSLPKTAQKDWTLTVLILLILSISIGAWWLKQPYTYPEAQQFTHQFMALLRQKQYDSAFALTAQPSLVGATPEALSKLAEHECLDDQSFAYSTPPQTNGNRLRRWLKDEPIDQTKINLDFQHTCLLGVQLIKDKQGEWRILRFGGHAG